MLKRTLIVLACLATATVAAAADHTARGEGCCMRAPGFERVVTNLENGVRITLTAEDPSAVAELQRRTETCPNGGCDCPMHAEGVSRTVDKTTEGVVITATSSDPTLVKKLQQHAAEAAGGCGHKASETAAGCRKKGGAAHVGCARHEPGAQT